MLLTKETLAAMAADYDLVLVDAKFVAKVRELVNENDIYMDEQTYFASISPIIEGLAALLPAE